MKQEKLLEKLESVFFKVKKGVDFVAVVGAFYILLFQIPALRKICKAICRYLIRWGIPADIADFKNIYFGVEVIFRLGILLWIMLTAVLFMIRIIFDRKLKKETGKNRFEESMFRYLQDAAVSRCFLITGKWGSGKTYEVNRFFDQYYRHSRTMVYRVSCFGLNSRKDLVEEINHTIEQKDESIYALIIKVLQFLPVIGEAINKFLKKSYTYTSVKKGSIFIFDDFERITSRTITSGYSGQIYHQSPKFLSKASNVREFDEIKREFKSVEQSFQKIEDFINKHSLREDYDKYIAVTGLINELVESYGMKVIIVCNSDILGEKFLHDILRSKLNCVEYKKVITHEIQSAVLKQVLENKIFDDTDKQQCIINYLKTIHSELTGIMQNTVFSDLRLFRGLFEAFTDTAILFKREELTEDFLNSLFNSIMVTHLSYYNHSIGKLDRFVNGANLIFLHGLFPVLPDIAEVIMINDSAYEMKWVDVNISGYWILNLSVPNDTAEIYEEWENYKYAVLEWRMLQNAGVFQQEDDYGLRHVLFHQKTSGKGFLPDSTLYTVIAYALQDYDLSKIEVVQGILDEVNAALDYKPLYPFQEVLFAILSEGHAEGRISGETYLCEAYNKFLEVKSDQQRGEKRVDR